MVGPKGMTRIAELIGAMVPFVSGRSHCIADSCLITLSQVTYLNSVVMPDGDGDSSGEEEGGYEDEDAAAE